MFRDLFAVHFRLGYTRLLLFVDAAIASIILADFIRYQRYGFSLYSSLLLSPEVPESITSHLAVPERTLIFCLFLLLVLPLVSAMLKIIDVPWISNVNISRRPVLVLVFHIIFVAACALSVALVFRLELSSGWAEVRGGYLPQFRSFYGTLVASRVFTAIISTLVSLSGTALIGIFLYLLIGRGSPAQLKQYAVKARLADLPADFRPKMVSYLSFDNHLGAAPPLPVTEAYARRLLRSYYLRSNTTSKQIELLDEQLTDCRQIVRERLVEVPGSMDTSTLQISFYTGPGRAFEAAARSMGSVSSCILFPFLSDSVRTLFSGMTRLMGCSVVEPALLPAEYYLSWKEQENTIISRLTELSPCSGATLVVIPDVAYSSGLRLPVSSVITRLKGALPNNVIRVIVDGTNAIGNRCLLQPEAAWDAYVFAPYRWLMVTERSGIVITRPPCNVGSTDYGLLRDGVRRRDEEVRTIASIRSALEVVNDVGLKYFWDRCTQLRSAFEAGMPRGFQILGSQSGLPTTYVLSCFPIQPTEWRFGSKELDDRLSGVSEYASMLSIDPRRPWLRISFPYHLDPRKLNRLNTFLDEKST